jgi:hypothetical protein
MFNKGIFHMQDEVLMAASMKMAVIWGVVLYSLVEIYRRFSGGCCLRRKTQ